MDRLPPRSQPPQLKGVNPIATNEIDEKHLKRVSKRKPKQTQFNDSITGVHPVRTHGFGIWGAPRGLHTIRLDDKLYKAFKPIAIAYFGSVCNPLEAFMATIVSTYQTNKLNEPIGVHPSNTVEIGKLVIERNVRPRRKLVVEEGLEVLCGHAKCNKVAVGHGVFREKLPLPLCEKHFEEAKKLFWEWSDVKLLEASP